MVKYYARTFLPWILLAVVSGFDVRAGALSGLAAAVLLLIDDRRKGTPWDAMILDASSTLYMAVLSVLTLVAPHLAVLRYGTSLAIGWLAITAWTGLAIGRPFTMGIARRSVSEFVSSTPTFRRVNIVITTVWALCFTADAVVLAVLQHRTPHNLAALVVCKVVFFAAATVFTARYPKVVQRRLGITPERLRAAEAAE
ncbi:hypothetical protein [Nocardia sp. alder85J]|uniref:hypothetical protein n=1 Tax=Nocardia sp. alder85J TaxID=2862949 RepID=UPI001CD3C094|nr:hypothetical protein [Nocardia sp. alder85J]MCX4093789.1 hypothetical protein [Nocardia sp. alder85J]